MSTRIEVYNEALLEIGADPIAGMDGDTAEEIAARNLYGSRVTLVLGAKPWRPAMNFAWPARVSVDPLPDRWDAAWMLPADCLAPWHMEEDGEAVAYTIFGTYLLTRGASRPALHYTQLVGPSRWSPGMRNAIVLRIAASLARSLRADPNLAAQLDARADRVLALAASQDAMTFTTRRLDLSAFLRRRRTRRM